MLEHFNHLRRQWAAKAQFLLANLKKTRAANMDEVIGQCRDSQGDVVVNSVLEGMKFGFC